MVADVELMCRVRAGDLPAYNQLWERHHSPLTHFLIGKLRCSLAAEELASEAFWRIYRSRAAYQPTAKFTTWLYAVALNLATNWRRDASRERRRLGTPLPLDLSPARTLPAANATPEQQLINKALGEELRSAIARLPSTQRRALLLYRFWDLPYAGVARQLGCSESAVKSLLFRAHSNLRNQLAASGYGLTGYPDA